MGVYASYELVDGEWDIDIPGFPAGQWNATIADTFLFYIEINSEGFSESYFFGAHPGLVFGPESKPESDPDYDRFIQFFTDLYPGREDEIRAFVERYRSRFTDTETRYVDGEGGDDLLLKWCEALGVEPPEIG